MEVHIDEKSGYCFGVEYAIDMAEQYLEDADLYCLGDIVHNRMEVERLEAKGLKIIDKDDLMKLKDCRVLIRAHGEPAETYKIAMQRNIELIDASCPVVLKLQNRIYQAYQKTKELGGQLVIYGKVGHAEIIGLNGQINNQGIVISSVDELDKLDFERPIVLFSQTTKSTKGFYELKAAIEARLEASGKDLSVFFDGNDSICRQVSNREPQMMKFSQEHDVIVFVSGKKSSNGKALYGVCLCQNKESYFIESEDELEYDWFTNASSVGICGATSTPRWLMSKVADRIKEMTESIITT